MRQICVVATEKATNCYDDQRGDGLTATKLNLVYWYDNLGNLTSMGDRSAGYTVGGAGQTAHSYGYDDLDRLVSGSATLRLRSGQARWRVPELRQHMEL